MALMTSEKLERIQEDELRTKMPMDEETRLLSEAREGNPGAWNELYGRYQKRILRLAVRITRNHEDAEDVAQMAFQKAFTHLDSFKGGSMFATWLTRIAINEALMVIRQRKGNLTPLEGSISSENESPNIDIEDSRATPEERYAHLELRNSVVEGVLRLRPSLRAVVLLRELRNLSTEETASVLGISIAAVKARMFHARNKLRRSLSQIPEAGKELARPRATAYEASARAAV
jgi:RNA polymerase sigma-70 factor, ECF subfamily